MIYPHVLLPKYLFALCDMADCNQNDLYCLSINKVTQHVKIRCTIASESDFWGRWRWPTPTTPCMDQFINCQHIQDGLEEWITEAMVLAPRGGDLIFGQWSLREELPLGNVRDVGFCLGVPINWAGREAQVEMMMISVQEGCWAIADAIMVKRTKARDQDAPAELQRQTRHPQQCTTSKSGCKAWRKMLPKWSWEMMKWVVMGLSGRKLILSIWVEVEDGMEDKVPHDYEETLLVDPPLQEEGVQIGEVSGVPIRWPWLEGLGE